MGNSAYLICLLISVIASYFSLIAEYQLLLHIFIPIAFYCFVNLFFETENVVLLSITFYTILIGAVMMCTVPNLVYIMAKKFNIMVRFFAHVAQVCDFYNLDNLMIIVSLIIFFVMILTDGKLSENLTTRKTISALICCVLFSCLTIFAFNNKINIARYDFKSDKIQNEIKIAHVSDTHNDEYLLDNLYKIIENENVDLILLTGDIFDEISDFAHTRELMKQLVSVAPVYYVLGNHEIYAGRTFEYVSEMENIGVNYIGDKFVNVNVKNEEIIIGGLNDPELERYYRENKKFSERLQDLTNGVNKNDSDKLKILLSHRHDKVDLYKNSGFDFVLSGHTHGGQVRIPILDIGIVSPDKGVFPKYEGGLYKISEETKLIVSRGMKIKDAPRIMNPPELVIITIHS